MLVGLFHVSKTHSLMPAIEGAHVWRFLPRAALPLTAPARGGTLARQRLLSISVTHLLSPFTQIQWGKLALKLHCSEELFFSALSRPPSSLLQGRGQVNFTPCKIMSPAVKDGLTLTHSLDESI